MKLLKMKRGKNILNVYRLYLKAFPKSERKPFPFILLRQWKGTTEVLVIKNNNGDFLGMAISVIHSNLVLLAYFAISDNQRGEGIGSKAFQMLKERYKEKKFFLEIENTGVSEAPNINQRIKRKDFYLKNGMIELPFIIDFFGTEMEIMINNLPLTFNEYHSIYKKEFGNYISRKVKFVKYKK
ncbi:GNAT family N-acetyltransferase [Leptotrichia sp. OH3620_COT-345]|uniref:GNAT family N-acetyltransferase n=1 Tax=Leptotrichia sp. OH3620_COT-345 TaxID=2491048 RepID=UPI000F651631|nr:GNAT family N-acetyltransferase [Leptotrichia sp. OH3620_COT-345]RRD41070.1 GNAT family N-acetyltransferase [Leptotrichia sp. OH3620_COT-345]